MREAIRIEELREPFFKRLMEIMHWHQFRCDS